MGKQIEHRDTHDQVYVASLIVQDFRIDINTRYPDGVFQDEAPHK